MLKKVLIFLCFMAAMPQSSHAVFAPFEQPLESISITGRLSWETYANEKWLVLHSVEAHMYRIQGPLVPELAKLVDQLGEKNMVTLQGRRDAEPTVVCTTTRTPDAEHKLHTETICYAYYNFVPAAVQKSGVSEQAVPAAKRETTFEKMHQEKSTVTGLPRPMVQVAATITAVNMLSPIKSVEITYTDKDDKPQTRTLIVDSSTVVAKQDKANPQKPVYVEKEQLQTGQKTVVIYSFDPDTGISSAVFITIVKE